MGTQPLPPDSKVMEALSKIFEAEMSGIIRYLHYSFMIMGHNRIPIQAWFRAQANENMAHAVMIGGVTSRRKGRASRMPAPTSSMVQFPLPENWTCRP